MANVVRVQLYLWQVNYVNYKESEVWSTRKWEWNKELFDYGSSFAAAAAVATEITYYNIALKPKSKVYFCLF